jgi:hypothetical protein
MRIRLGLLCLLLTATTASAQSLEQQAICAKQAKVAYDQYNNDPSNAFGLLKPITSGYENHYNTKLNKCFIAIESVDQMGEESLTTAVLMDAFEHRIYANYSWSTRVDKKWEVPPPTTCDLIPSTKDQTHCSSKAEYDAFVAKYMEE